MVLVMPNSWFQVPRMHDLHDLVFHSVYTYLHSDLLYLFSILNLSFNIGIQEKSILTHCKKTLGCSNCTENTVVKRLHFFGFCHALFITYDPFSAVTRGYRVFEEEDSM